MGREAEAAIRKDLTAAKAEVSRLEQALKLVTGTEAPNPKRPAPDGSVMDRVRAAVCNRSKKTAQVAKAAGCSHNRALDALRWLRAEGEVEETSGNAVRDFRWRLAPAHRNPAKPKRQPGQLESELLHHIHTLGPVPTSELIEAVSDVTPSHVRSRLQRMREARMIWTLSPPQIGQENVWVDRNPVKLSRDESG